MAHWEHRTPDKPCLSLPLLERLSRRIEKLTGQYFPVERFQDLDRNVRAAARELGHSDIESFARWLLATPLAEKQIKALATYFTVGETYFFRDSRIFRALRDVFIPRILASSASQRKKIKIWSAGCSSGEEPYSIAMLLADMISDIGSQDISILGTDINSHALEQANRGIYRTWALRRTGQLPKTKWFTLENDLFVLSPKIRNMVTFTYLNLMDDSYPVMANAINNIDLIFCRNVLMYFSKDRAARIISKLEKLLCPTGILVLDSVEGGIPQTQTNLVRMPLPGICAFQKRIAQDSISRPYVTWPEAARSCRHEFSTVLEKEETNDLLTDCRDAEPACFSLDRIKSLANRGRTDQAMTMCNKALQADPFNAPLHYLKATFLQEMNRTSEAIVSLQQTLYIDQDFLMAHFSLGHLLRAQGRLTAAQAHLSTVLRLLEKYQENDILPETEGMCAGELMRIASRHAEKERP